MDIYVIKFADGRKEECRTFFQFRNRVTELENLGLKKGDEFKTYQLWI